MAIDIIKKEKVSLKSSLVTLLSHQGKLTKAAANSKNIYIHGIPLSQEVEYTILSLLCFQKSSKYLTNIS